MLLLALALPLLAGPSTSGGRATRPATRRQWLGLVGRRVHRRQRAVRPLLRGPRPRGRDAGRLHPEDARRLGRAPRRPAPARAARACRTWPRSRSLLAGQAWLAGGAGTVVFGAGEAMILAATLLWAVEVVLVEAAARRARAAHARGGADGARDGRCSSAGSRLRAGWATCSRSAPSSGAGSLLTGLLLTALRRHLVRGARARAGRRRDRRARLRRGRHRPALRRGRRRGARRRSALILVTAGAALIALAALRRPSRAGGRVVTRGAAPLRALRLPAERARPLRRRRDPDAARVRRRRASPTAASPSSRARSRARGRTSTLIAGANGIADPLDPRVVEAYWVGNELLDRVAPGALARHVEERFRGRIGRALEHVARRRRGRRRAAPLLPRLRRLPVARAAADGRRRRAAPRARSVPHDAGPRRVGRRRRDCRSPSRPLLLERTAAARSARGRRARCAGATTGSRSLDAPSPGDWVSLHWDFACDRLTPPRRRSARPGHPTGAQGGGRIVRRGRRAGLGEASVSTSVHFPRPQHRCEPRYLISRVDRARPQRRDHHGRQRPLGGAARAAGRGRATARARARCGGRSRRRSTSASSRSPSTPSRPRTGRVRPTRSTR